MSSVDRFERCCANFCIREAKWILSVAESRLEWMYCGIHLTSGIREVRTSPKTKVLVKEML